MSVAPIAYYQPPVVAFGHVSSTPALPIAIEELNRRITLMSPLRDYEREYSSSLASELNINGALNAKQINLLRNPHSESSISRSIAYLKQHPQVITHGGLISHNTRELGLDDAVEYSQAGFLGFSYSLMDSDLLRSADPSILTYIEVAVGLRLGIVVVINIQKILASRGYRAWRQERELVLESNSFCEFIAKDDVLSKYLCPITKKIPTSPVKFCKEPVEVGHPIEIGNTYEEEAIVQWLSDHPGQIFPGEKEVYTRVDLSYDFAYVNTVRDRINKILAYMQGTAKVKELAGFTFLNAKLTSIGNKMTDTRAACAKSLRLKLRHEYRDDLNSVEYTTALEELKHRVSKSRKVVVVTDSSFDPVTKWLFGIKPTQRSFII
jgi:hypothetical protein